MLRLVPNLLSRRARAGVAGVAGLSLALLAYASPSAQPVAGAVESLLASTGGTYEQRRVPLTLASGRALTLNLYLQRDHVAHADRMVDAAREALDQYNEWFAPYPQAELSIVDVPWRSAAAGRSGPGFVTVAVRWWQPERSFTLEAQIARGIARQWWGGLVRVEDRFLADGLAEYAQSRTLERIYDRRHQRPAYSTHEIRVFGGLVPWAVRALRLDRLRLEFHRALPLVMAAPASAGSRSRTARPSRGCRQIARKSRSRGSRAG